MANLGRSFRHPRDEAALAIDDADKPVSRNVLSAEEAQELSVPHDNGEPAKGQAVLEDGNLDIGNQILRQQTSRRSVITIERVENARCSAAIAIGLRRGRGGPG